MFAQITVIAECKNLQMSEVLAHPLEPHLWTLANTDGTLRRTNKASLAKELQKTVQAADVILQPSACLIDGMALVQRLKGGQKTFAAIAESLLSMKLNEGTSSDRIDQFRYIKIQSQTIDLRTRLWGINPTNSVFIPQSLVLRSIV